MALPTSPAERHRAVAGTFTEKVLGVGVDGALSWDAPAPVDGWTARDVVRHLIDWLSGLLDSGAGITLDHGPPVDDDPVAAWRVHAAAVQALLDDPRSADQVLTNPHFGSMPLDKAIQTLYTSDVFMHTWDLARATGQDDGLDADFAEELVTGMAPIEEMLRASGQFGTRVEVPPGSDARTRLIGFIGRDPLWTPPGDRGRG